jgi:hypothetical protein
MIPPSPSLTLYNLDTDTVVKKRNNMESIIRILGEGYVPNIVNGHLACEMQN